MNPWLIAALAYFFLRDKPAAVPAGAGTPAPAPFVATTASIATGNAALLQSVNAPSGAGAILIYRQPLMYPVDPLLGTAVNPVNTSIASTFTPADPVQFEDGGRAPYRETMNWL